MFGIRGWGTHRRVGALVLLVSAGLFVAPAYGETPRFGYEHRVLLDTDQNLQTGCTLPVNDENISTTISGVDHVVIMRVPFSKANAQVIEVVRRECVMNSLGAEILVSDSGWNVGDGTGIDGSDVIEGLVTLAALGKVTAPRVLAFFSTATGTSDVAIPGTLGIGAPLLNPWLAALTAMILFGLGTISIRRSGRRRGAVAVGLVLLSAGAAIGAGAVLMDGETNDWAGIQPLVRDVAGDSTSADSAEDIVAGFMQADGANAYFRIDVVDATIEPCSDC